ncbi:hypothetical protein CYLTODRAFT_399625 [Cylindrobasidium torrendii FP15055 ss-10]|uniref:DBF4-type domain-containing protein n=1 Tax=Cylindrobasidium torrendii FP15055 ss-10 TaxID=1314674 RepID=A0A0D7B5Z0_9AGAR|nr:hypothetical protein CYLTODRAFT_399625 [Cylindrobasidium torrendii FP15055 ss-10]
MSTTRVALNPRPAVTRSSRLAVGTKRAHSPDRHAEQDSSAKRRALESKISATPRAAASDIKSKHAERERRDMERYKKDIEWKSKYTKAFPAFSFHFDADNLSMSKEAINNAKADILALKGKIEDFFSKDITYLISDYNAQDAPRNKENRTQRRLPGSACPSPTKTRVPEATLYTKAVNLEIGVWSTSKLKVILDRLLSDTAEPKLPIPERKPNLKDLLATEKITGSTTERDPTQRRHDWTYFEPDSYYVLVEDIHGKQATIIAHQYTPKKGEKEPWPVLYCDPRSSNPFRPFDEKEKKRMERVQQEEKSKKDKAREKVELQRIKNVERRVSHGHDLRRAASVGNLQRRLTEEEEEELEVVEDLGSANASGFLASGYVAASGNSVSIASTHPTTSTSGSFVRQSSMNSALRKQQQHEVLTSRKAMAPPPVPHDLRRTRSTNTLRPRVTTKLPKRDEGAKPGYCECCREKFSDYKTHIKGDRHRRFAENEKNFRELDSLLGEVKRRPVEEAWIEDQWRSPDEPTPEPEIIDIQDDDEEEEY